MKTNLINRFFESKTVEAIMWTIAISVLTILPGIDFICLTAFRTPSVTYLVQPVEGYFIGCLFIFLGIACIVAMMPFYKNEKI